MKKLVFLAIVAMFVFVSAEIAFAEPNYEGYQATATGEPLPSKTKPAKWLGGLSLEGGFGSETGGKVEVNKLYPEGFVRWDLGYLISPKFGFLGEASVPLSFDELPRVGGGPLFVVTDELRVDIPVFYQYVSNEKEHLVGVAVRSNVEVYRVYGDSPVAICFGFAAGAMSPSERRYANFLLGLTIGAPVYSSSNFH